MIKYILFICIHLTAFLSRAMAIPDASQIRYEDYIYVDYIKSIMFNDGTSQYSDPIAKLGNTLQLSFDDINDQEYQFSYMIIHCDRDWNPSSIDPIEYMTGFNYADIESPGQNSRFTKVDYWHYQLAIPNNDVRWTISGNYLLLVYDQEDNPVFSKRFVIYEGVGKLESNRGHTIGPGQSQTHHRIETNYTELPEEFINEMYQAGLEVKTMQNHNWSTLSEGYTPIRYQSDAFLFNNAEYPSFPSLQEYRQCDTRALEFNGINLLEVETTFDSIFALLQLAEPKRKNLGMSEFDLNGRFFIDRRDDSDFENTLSEEPVIEVDYELGDRLMSEYAWTIFSINAEWLQAHIPVYVIGGFSDYKLYPEYGLNYDAERNIFIGAALMKQGRYDYHFVQIEDGNLDYTATERSDEQSSQDYRTFVYYRDFGDEYDRVLNTTFLNVNRGL